MRMQNLIFLLTCAVVLPTVAQSPEAGGQESLLERLRNTRAIDMKAVIDAQFEPGDVNGGFLVVDPYGPEAAETVSAWQNDPRRLEQVCAVRFSNMERTEYRLRGFDSPQAAAKAGYRVTHQGRCGTCSTLRDLASYLARPDLTTPARQCARRAGMGRKKQCFMEQLGFTPHCAESWAYNARHTRQECLGTCISDYGLINLILNRYPGPNVDESGQLRPCLRCDEDKSGAGFKFSAGRTRRNSGIRSAIPRQESEIYAVDHSAYFR
jgi:hypothetical protein